MYITAELILTSYVPKKLEAGMLFVENYGDYVQVYDLPRDVDEKLYQTYLERHGSPVELELSDTSLGHLIAKGKEIGWVMDEDDGETIEIHEITINDINTILANKHQCQVEIEDDKWWKEKMIVPIYEEEKVIIRIIEEEEE